MDGSKAGQKDEFTIVLTGKTRSGKSSLIQTLLSEQTDEMGKSVFFAPRSEMVEIKSITKNGKLIHIVDTPSLTRKLDLSSEYLQEFDLLVFCISVNPGSRFPDGNPEKMRSLQEAYGKDIWKHCMVVFTFSNIAWDESNNENPGNATIIYTKYIEDFLDSFREELTTNLGLAPDVNVKTIFNSKVRGNAHAHGRQPGSILAIPAGMSRQDQVLPGVDLHGGSWIDEIFNEMLAKCGNGEGRVRYREASRIQHQESRIQYQEKPKPPLRVLYVILFMVGIVCGARLGVAMGDLYTRNEVSMAIGNLIRTRTGLYAYIEYLNGTVLGAAVERFSVIARSVDARISWMTTGAVVGATAGLAIARWITRKLHIARVCQFMNCS